MFRLPCLTPLLLLVATSAMPGEVKPLSNWQACAPRAEISPDFEQDENGLHIISASRELLHGYWQRDFRITSENYVLFTARRFAENVEYPRRSCLVRIEWYDDDLNPVTSSHPVNPAYFDKDTDVARPEFPPDVHTFRDGSVELSGHYRVPEMATIARVQLHLRWAPSAKVRWSHLQLEGAEAPAPRKVRLAAIHVQLPGSNRTAEANREILAKRVFEAAEQKADLIVLPEFGPCKGLPGTWDENAEPIPGPSTKYFGGLSKKHDCYIVLSLPERDGYLIYNTAVLLGPKGTIEGTYRKVSLPMEEIAAGIAPGNDYPVFVTRFGTLGMMVCYDVFFPEVARELSHRGAEVIALPIWGGNPKLAAARCAENGIFLVSSTYTPHGANWMKTAIWDREGNRVVEAKDWGQVLVHEVDLGAPTYWKGLGDFKSRILREGPVRVSE